jgi:hypothetical protein
VLDRVNRRDGFSMKKPFRSSARGASFHTKHALNVNVGRVVLLDANSYLALGLYNVVAYEHRLLLASDTILKLRYCATVPGSCGRSHVCVTPYLSNVDNIAV